MPLELFDLQVLNAVGDLLDLEKALFPEEIPDFHSMTKHQLLTYVRRHSHCSALIKLLPGAILLNVISLDKKLGPSVRPYCLLSERLVL